LPRIGERLHPLTAVYRLDVVDLVMRLIRNGRSALIDLVDVAATRLVGGDELRDVDPELKSLDNINTPEDYERALRGV
ncbi:MAG: molybdopterin-guanine dinucleotide biosynthesis protein MobA, partial [Planctomycetes bacterium]|nr:molybdopterin-guanine dinucleotide biosynthesis protein MobA [Planctomycetota bacterium]